MATKKEPEILPYGHPVDWQYQSEHRVLPAWNVALMSFGIDPTPVARRIALRDEKFKKKYMARIKAIGLKLSKSPRDGHVTYFPDHPYNKRSDVSRNRVVDVVSCIDVLERLFPGDLPEEFLALKEPLSKFPLLIEQSASQNLNTAPIVQTTTITSTEKVKKDQSARNATLMSQNLLALIYAMARGGYAYDPSGQPAQNKETIASIFNDVSKFVGREYGLSETNIRKFVLEGSKRCEKD